MFFNIRTSSVNVNRLRYFYKYKLIYETMNKQDKKITDAAKQLVEAIKEKGLEQGTAYELIQIWLMDNTMQVSVSNDTFDLNIETLN